MACKDTPSRMQEDLHEVLVDCVTVKSIQVHDDGYRDKRDAEGHGRVCFSEGILPS